MAVPLFDTAATLAPLRGELRAAMEGVLESEQAIQARVRRIIIRTTPGAGATAAN